MSSSSSSSSSLHHTLHLSFPEHLFHYKTPCAIHTTPSPSSAPTLAPKNHGAPNVHPLPVATLITHIPSGVTPPGPDDPRAKYRYGRLTLTDALPVPVNSKSSVRSRVRWVDDDIFVILESGAGEKLSVVVCVRERESQAARVDETCLGGVIGGNGSVRVRDDGLGDVVSASTCRRRDGYGDEFPGVGVSGGQRAQEEGAGEVGGDGCVGWRRREIHRRHGCGNAALVEEIVFEIGAVVVGG
ncbi:hypothetical protein BGAL_0646g00020 [Botrytis galanthina]|uniref:Uncharacterized protein n=1 Tax=Botrytis galanthina TaxID=278940 RepID=A0A4S8QI88_9HELO|nr:hypothetical protein BGAL_0646g00020 [Botrytis galanthina]